MSRESSRRVPIVALDRRDRLGASAFTVGGRGRCAGAGIRPGSASPRQGAGAIPRRMRGDGAVDRSARIHALAIRDDRLECDRPSGAGPRVASVRTIARSRARSTPSARRPWRWIVDRSRLFLPAVVGIWTAGIIVCSLRLSGGWVQARRWVRLDTCPLADSVIDRLSERMGVRCRVAYLKSSRVAVPMVVGWLRPAILVPVAALSGLTALEMEAILAHELAHIRRHDYLVNLLQCVVETLMFHHPATWWISRVIRCEREHCCDDIAVSACHDRVVYARALAALEGLRVPAFSLSPAASGGNLLARIRRILNPVEESMKPVRIGVAMVAAVALVPIWLVRAGTQTKAEPASSPSELVRREPFPDRSVADIITQIEQAPAGQFTVGVGDELVDRVRLALSNATPQSVGPSAATVASTESRARSSLVILPDDAGAAGESTE